MCGDAGADDGEAAQSDGVEHRWQPAPAVDQPSRRPGDGYEERDNQDHGGDASIGEPSHRRPPQHDIAQRAAADRLGEGHGADAHQIHVAPLGRQRPVDGERD